MSQKPSNQLRKEITFFPALSLVMGTVIGAGIFFKSSAVYSTTGSASLGTLAWILSGIITIFAGLTVAELAAAIPKTGGMMMYIDHTYGKLSSFLLGWSQTIITFPSKIAALSIISATQVINLFAINDSFLLLIAIAFALSIFSVNLISAKAGGILQLLALIGKLVPLGLIIIAGLFFNPNPIEFELLPIKAGESKNFISALAGALLATMYAYDGWIHVGNIAGEMKNPQKDLPKAIGFGLSFIMIVYLLINVVFLLTLSVSEIAGNKNASNYLAHILFGDFGGKIITIGILVSVYGTLNGIVMMGMRIPYAMALENKLPFSSCLRKLNKSKVPYMSALLIFTLSILLMVWAGDFDILTDISIFILWIFYNITFLAVIILRKREPNLVRPYKVPLYPFIPLLALGGGVFIIIMTFYNQPILSLVAILVAFSGTPIYFYKKSKNQILD